MREVVLESRVCNVCGSRAEVVRERLNVEARVVTFLRELRGDRRVRAPRVRSGVAYAAGYAGVLYLFTCSLAPFAPARWGIASVSGALLVIAWNIFAPLALLLSFAAGVSLDRSREKTGALPAMFGLFVGLLGTVDLLLVFSQWLKFLEAF